MVGHSSGLCPVAGRDGRSDSATRKLLLYIGLEVLTTVTMKVAAFWAVMPCSVVEVYRRLGVTYYFHLQSR
jgi:hypothetical protein